MYGTIIMEGGQNDCLNEILAMFKTGSCGIKTRSLGQILEKPCEQSRGHMFSPIFMKLGKNDGLDEISNEFEIGSCGVKN